MSLKWEAAPGVFVAFLYQKRSPYGTRAAVRVIQERTTQQWRCDFAPRIANAWAPWEAIDAIEHETAEGAKAHVEAWEARGG